ncbi:MAG: glycoside hydrolase family 2 TIM barrel-domain containing protein [Angelakisella sp.]
MKIEERLLHPNPQFMREQVMDLNGEWDFEFDSKNEGVVHRWFEAGTLATKIRVPFAYQSQLSGISTPDAVCEVVWYKRKVVLEPSNKKRYILHFEACDYHTTVWVNGCYVTEHRGGFTPFMVDVTQQLTEGENDITLRVEDTTSPTQLLGKQSWKAQNFLCWYTRTTGVWQQIWLEVVPEVYIKDIYIRPNTDANSVSIELSLSEKITEGSVEVEIKLGDRLVNYAAYKVMEGCVTATLDVYSPQCDFQVEYWSPDSPVLYDLNLCYLNAERQIQDKVQSYFGMRKISVSGNKILLNNKEFYQKLVLNQGYYGKGLMTPQSSEQLRHDVEMIKACGFNGMRVHQTVASRALLFLCDALGLVVWSEMPSFYRFTQSVKQQYFSELSEAIVKQYNHPCIITWVLFNESWGVNCIYDNEEHKQFVNAAVSYAKALDGTRLCIGNDGWEHADTDILSVHDYTAQGEKLHSKFAVAENERGFYSETSQRSNFADGCVQTGKPIIISEIGGIAYGEGGDEAWGYGMRLTTQQECLERFSTLIRSITELETVCGYCYTQWTDIEQEINGILDSEHNPKFSLDAIREINSSAKNMGYIFG